MNKFVMMYCNILTTRCGRVLESFALARGRMHSPRTTGRALSIHPVRSLCLRYQSVMFPNPYKLYLELIIHIITIRQGGVSLFTFQLVGPKLYIKLLVILVLTYGITYLIIFQQMCLILPLNIL